MNVTFLATHSLESPGGGGRFFPLAKALTQHGYRVTMITLHHDYAHVSPKEFVRDGVRIKYVGQMHVHKSGSQKTYFNPLRLLWITAVATVMLAWHALRTPTDLIHVCKAQPMNGLAAWFVRLVRRIPVYLDSDDHEAINNRFSGRWQQRLVAWFEDWLPTFVAGITANTTYIIDHYRALGVPPERLAWVPNGVDKATFSILDQPNTTAVVAALKQEWQIADAADVVVYVGSMSLVGHAIDLLLDAFALVRQELPSAVLVLAGAGENLTELETVAQSRGLGPAVRFTGRIPAEQVPYYYRLGTVSVDPRRADRAAASSFSLKLVESLASGTPCVTCDIGDRREAVGAAGLAVAPGDAAALADGILSILQQPALAAEMGAAARQMRDQLWWEARLPAFISLYPPDKPTALCHSRQITTKHG